MTDLNNVNDPIERYLDDLEAALTVSAHHRRRILAETRDHLLDASAAPRASGLDARSAARAAIEAFGPPEAVAAAFAPEPTLARLGTAIYLHLAMLAGAVLVTIGLSGAIGGAIGVVWGADSISGPAPTALTPAECAQFAATEPGAAGCADAWSSHALEESVLYRGLLGVLGAAIIVLHLGLAYRYLPTTSWSKRATWAAIALAVVGFGVVGLATVYANTVLETNTPPLGPAQVGSGWWWSIQLANGAAFCAALTALAVVRRGGRWLHL